MKTFCFFIFLAWITSFSSLSAQTIQRPKLVVGIVVDQMRWDYLYRYYSRYGAGGFKRLLGDGFSCENTFIPYTPTNTAAGHACIYTGSVPALNGMMGNTWYDRIRKKVVYCTEDHSVQTVGSESVEGKMSPRNLWSSTITDELRLATNFKNKTISIAIKDRGSILPGGHSSNGSYWFDNSSAGWISSNFYMQELPSWLKKMNERKIPDSLMKRAWNTLYPLHTYTASTTDSNTYEGRLPGEDFTFPHRTDTITRSRSESFRHTPGAATYTFETAKEAIRGEKLGSRGVTDFLAVSLSSLDYAGHVFGPNSVEIEDHYLRLDKDLESFLRFLDTRVGKGQYLLFLTSDHAAAQNTGFLRDQHFPVGSFDQAAIRRQMNDSLEKIFRKGNLISQYISYQLYLNDSVIQAAGLDKGAIKSFIIDYMMRQPAVSQVIDLSNLANTTLNARLRMMLENSYNQKLGSDLQIIPRPQWLEGWRTGTNHGQWNPYDSHIPLLWFGWKIRQGHTNREVYMTDIAPTLAALLHIQMPNASIGKVIEEITK